MTEEQINTIMSTVEKLHLTMDSIHRNIVELEELIQMKYNPETNLWCPPHCAD